jgi:hypothetical protein
MSGDDKFDFIINALSDSNRRMARLEQSFAELRQLVQDRLYDTRPLWEGVLQRLDRLEQGQRSLEEGQQRLEQGKRSQDEKLTQILHQLSILNDDLLAVRGGQRELRQRVAMPEQKPAA